MVLPSRNGDRRSRRSCSLERCPWGYPQRTVPDEQDLVELLRRYRCGGNQWNSVQWSDNNGFKYSRGTQFAAIRWTTALCRKRLVRTAVSDSGEIRRDRSREQSA